MRQEGPAKLDIQIKSDWLLICLTFVAKSPGLAQYFQIFSVENWKSFLDIVYVTHKKKLPIEISN